MSATKCTTFGIHLPLLILLLGGFQSGTRQLPIQIRIRASPSGLRAVHTNSRKVIVSVWAAERWLQLHLSLDVNTDHLLLDREWKSM